MPVTLEQLQTHLAEARDAHHTVMIGEGVAEFQDSNGERVRYTQANVGRLETYITNLEHRIANFDKPKTTGPMRVFF